MGSGTSKPESERSQHVFTSETPVQFSQGLLDSLQGSPETDSTREKTRELHIQSRVGEELQRLQAHESQLLKDLEHQISSEIPDEDIAKGQGQDGKEAGNRLRDLGRESVQRDITALRKKLEGRKKLEALDKDVEKAKDEVVHCLRLNDRRPLDCWKEVDTFRREVGRLEKSFVDRALQ
ncbi:MAG: hypothetical protein M1837_000906 [Sclerophora amabilis]|nr:MAG: hypothetical protein M1837_000906 [Sclerophora amabilis]